MSTKITKAVVASLSLSDLLGACVPYVAPTQAAKVPRVSRALLTNEEKKAARNAAQKLLRSTPEGKAYANAASKKSIAAKKARIEAELATLKNLINWSRAVVTPTEVSEVPAEVPAEVSEVSSEVPVEEPIVKAPNKKRGNKKAPKATAEAEEDAPL